MKTKVIVFILFFSIWASGQTVGSSMQAVIDKIYTANPSSVGIMVHVESPEHGISWSGARGYADKDSKAMLEPAQTALIAVKLKLMFQQQFYAWLNRESFPSISQSINYFRLKQRIFLYKVDMT